MKLKHKFLPLHYFLKLKRINYFWKIKTNQMPAFDGRRRRELKAWKINKMKELDSSSGAIKSKAQN